MSTIALPLAQARPQAVPFRLGHRPVLDGIRALAVLLVLIHHVEFIQAGIPTILRGGFLGVDLFFVLSGFLITSLLVEEFENCGAISLPRFYMRRALRLLPAVATVLTVSVLAGVLIGFSAIGLTPLRFVSIVGYFTNWVRAAESPDLWILAHFWSLAIEEQFYLIWPVVLLALLRRNVSHGSTLLVVILGAIASMALMTMLDAKGFPLLRVYVGSDTRGHALLIGCLLALMLRWNRIPADWLLNKRLMRLITAGSLIILILSSTIFMVGDRSLYRGGFPLIAVSSALLILSLVFNDRDGLGSVFCHPVCLWMGKRSYGLYVWHWPVYFLLGKLGLERAVAIPVALVGTFVVAALSYRFIESPFLKLKHRYSAVPQPATASVVSPQLLASEQPVVS